LCEVWHAQNAFEQPLRFSRTTSQIESFGHVRMDNDAFEQGRTDRLFLN
jgi:hypothetical protein